MTKAQATMHCGELEPAAPPPLQRLPDQENNPHTIIRLGGVTRMALALTPSESGPLQEQFNEVIEVSRQLLQSQEWPMHLVTQTVFLREAADQSACEALLRTSHLYRTAVCHFVVQPPCDGARFAVEAWAIGGPGVSVERYSPNAVAVAYDGLRWVHTRHLSAAPGQGVYADGLRLSEQAGQLLAAERMGWENVVRTWWYLAGITDLEGAAQRYVELNRARTDAFAALDFGHRHGRVPNACTGYPASTGIGMQAGSGLSLATLAVQSSRSDVRMLALENPLQTPAYHYAARYSPKSPKFSRAMAMVTPECVATWISGTASIMDSEVCHPGDIAAQTERTLANIAALIAPENFARHGQAHAGASLRDLAGVRVYVKRASDFAACRAACEEHLGLIPVVYVLADVCRPELLVEIEAVAFSRRPSPASK
jgi:enamine deaminase RidA (YjgF/YER057c/UK114 family)